METDVSRFGVYYCLSALFAAACQLYFLTNFEIVLSVSFLYYATPRGAGVPLSAFAPSLSIHFVIFCFFYFFSLLLFALPIFSIVHPFCFYQNRPTPFTGVRSLGGDRTWV